MKHGDTYLHFTTCFSAYLSDFPCKPATFISCKTLSYVNYELYANEAFNNHVNFPFHCHGAKNHLN